VKPRRPLWNVEIPGFSTVVRATTAAEAGRLVREEWAREWGLRIRTMQIDKLRVRVRRAGRG
jgi:hypothetical protein